MRRWYFKLQNLLILELLEQGQGLAKATLSLAFSAQAVNLLIRNAHWKEKNKINKIDLNSTVPTIIPQM